MVAVKVDAKGRLTIPRRLREELGIVPGDMLFVEREAGHEVLRYIKIENPFDALAEAAADEYRAGQTRSLRDFAVAHDFNLDGE